MGEDRDKDLTAAVRDLVRSGRQLGARTEQVLDRYDTVIARLTKLEAELAAVLARQAVTERQHRPLGAWVVAGIEAFFDLAKKSLPIQGAIAFVLIVAVTAVAMYFSPGILAALPYLGGSHAQQP